MSKTFRLFPFLSLFFLPLAAHASVVVKLDDEQMTAKADRVVHAKVVRKVAEWDSTDRRIYTYVTLAILDAVKGDRTTSEVVIRQVGGATNTYGMHVPGTPEFSVGEEVVVFLEKQHNPRFHHVIGMSSGKWSVSTNPQTNERRIHRDLKNVAFAEWNRQGTFKIHDEKSHAAKDAKPHALQTPAPLLSDFLKKIRFYVQNPRPLAPIPGMRVQPFQTIPAKQ